MVENAQPYQIVDLIWRHANAWGQLNIWFGLTLESDLIFWFLPLRVMCTTKADPVPSSLSQTQKEKEIKSTTWVHSSSIKVQHPKTRRRTSYKHQIRRTKHRLYDKKGFCTYNRATSRFYSFIYLLSVHTCHNHL